MASRSDSSRTEAETRSQIEQTEEAETEARAAKAVRLFDLRRLIGGLLSLYGVLLTAVGLFGSTAIKSKAAGININLWAGLAVLVGGLLFLAWSALRPLEAPEAADADAEAEADRGARVG